MSETDSKPKAAPKSSWPRRLIYAGAAGAVLLVICYAVATSEAFFKGVILPRAGKAVNAELSVDKASISPFSQVFLKGLTVRTTGGDDPLLQVDEIRVRYSLMAILGGNLSVNEVTVSRPTLTVVTGADGKSNLDALLQRADEPSAKPSQADSARTPSVDLRNFTVKDATLRMTTRHSDGRRETVEATQLSVSLDRLQNGESGKLTLGAALSVDRVPPQASAVADRLASRIDAAFNFKLTPQLQPESLQGTASLDVTEAQGALSDLARLKAMLVSDLTPTALNRLGIEFTQAGRKLGTVSVSGPIDLDRKTASLKLEISDIDHQVLNLAGATAGLDFGSTRINGTSRVDVTETGQKVALNADININRFSVTREGQTTPGMDLRFTADTTIDLAANSAVLRDLTIDGRQNQLPLLSGRLSRPMTLSWATADIAADDSSFDLSVTGMNLADWRAFAGDIAPDGRVSLKLALQAKQAGKDLRADLDFKLDDATLVMGDSRISGTHVALSSKAGVKDFNLLRLETGRLDVTQRNQLMLSGTMSGHYNLQQPDADLQVTMDGSLANLTAALNLPDLEASAGNVRFNGKATQKKDETSVAGKFVLKGFTGRHGDLRFADYSVETDVDAALKQDQALIRKLDGTISEGKTAGGSFTAQGSITPSSGAARLAFKLTGLNQHALRPVLAANLGDKSLISAALNGSGTVSHDPGGDSSVDLDVTLSNLVVKDPSGQLPQTPLGGSIQAMASVKNNILDLRRFQAALEPTTRAKNILTASGRVDMSQTNAVRGSIALKADSLDVTPYYDLFSGKPAEPTRAPAAPPKPAAADAEPDPVILPFRDFKVELSIARLYLREIEIADWQGTMTIDGGRVLLKPFQLTLNNTPVKADVDLDLSTPGYKYDLGFSAHALPMAPLVNSFQPDRKGQVGGSLTAQGQIKGAGVTGASLQKNLSGQFEFTATNLNLSIADVRSPLLNTIINTVVGIPEFIRNPTAALGNLVGRLSGTRPAGGGWADKLTASPINSVVVLGSAGNGQIDLKEASIRSDAFLAEAKGAVTLAPVLTNSTLQIPVQVSLKRSLAEDIRLVPSGTPTNAAYVQLPDFVTLRGTVGKPDPHVNKLVLAAVAAKAGAGVIGQTGSATLDKAAGILGAVGGVLTGENPSGTSTNAPAATNAPPATNQTLNPFDLFRRVVPKQ